MFKAKFNDKKFKTNVRLCIDRLKLVEKKKTEMALKARKEIADYIKIGKTGLTDNKILFGFAGCFVCTQMQVASSQTRQVLTACQSDANSDKVSN